MIRGMVVAGAVAAGVFAGAAQADVLYNWQQISSTAPIGQTSGRLLVTDTAYLAGSIDYRHGTSSGPSPLNIDPTSPVLNFFFSIGNPFGSVGVQPRSMEPNQGTFRLTFAGDGSLAGSISGDMPSSDVSLSGASVWTLLSFGSDFLDPCGFTGVYRCNGATGRWVLDTSTVPGRVPEPGILPLLALGAFGVAASMRRKRQ